MVIRCHFFPLWFPLDLTTQHSLFKTYSEYNFKNIINMVHRNRNNNKTYCDTEIKWQTIHTTIYLHYKLPPSCQQLKQSLFGRKQRGMSHNKNITGVFTWYISSWKHLKMWCAFFFFQERTEQEESSQQASLNSRWVSCFGLQPAAGGGWMNWPLQYPLIYPLQYTLCNIKCWKMVHFCNQIHWRRVERTQVQIHFPNMSKQNKQTWLG